jgi:hypothetical protein
MDLHSNSLIVTAVNEARSRGCKDVFFTMKSIFELADEEQPCPDGSSVDYLRLAKKRNRHSEISKTHGLIAVLEFKLNDRIAEALILEEQLLERGSIR